MSLYDRDWYREEIRERARDHKDPHRSPSGARAASVFEHWAKQEKSRRRGLRPAPNIFRWIALLILVLVVTTLIFSMGPYELGRRGERDTTPHATGQAGPANI